MKNCWGVIGGDVSQISIRKGKNEDLRIGIILRIAINRASYRE